MLYYFLREESISRSIRYIIAVFIFLWATKIAEDEKFDDVMDSSITVKQEIPKTVPAIKDNLKTLTVGADLTFDREAFIHSLTRQAKKELMSCLKKTFPHTTHQIFSGRLLKKGTLRDLKILGGQEDVPSCVIQEFEKINFEHLSKNLKTDSLVIQWNMEWE